MAYTPKTWTTGETITAAELNAIEQAASAAAATADTANAGLAGKADGAPTRRVGTSLGAARTVVAAVSIPAWGERIPIMLPVTTTRWRLRVANRSQLDGATLTTPWTVSDLYYGTPDVLAAGRLSGAFTAAPAFAAAGGAVPTDGTDYISPWVTDPTLQFQAGQYGMVGMILSTPGTSGNGTSTTSTRHGFRSNSSAAANAATLTVASGVGYGGNTLALDKRIEYEFVGRNPVGLYIGDSITEGFSVATSGDDTFNCINETWPGAVGLSRRIPWINAGIFGCTEAPFATSTSWGFSRFDIASYVPDFAVISLGSNSASASTAAATIESGIAAAVASVRALGVKRVFLGTILPRNFASGGAPETARIAVNSWIGGVPLGAAGCFDFDRVMRDPANPLICSADGISSDNTHPMRRGYQRMAAEAQLG